MKLACRCMLQWAFGCCKLHSDQCLQQRSQPRQRHTGVNWPQPGKVREQTLRTWQADRSTLAQCVRGVLTNPRKMPPGAEEEGFQSAELCRAMQSCRPSAEDWGPSRYGHYQCLVCSLCVCRETRTGAQRGCASGDIARIPSRGRHLSVSLKSFFAGALQEEPTWLQAKLLVPLTETFWQ